MEKTSSKVFNLPEQSKYNKEDAFEYYANEEKFNSDELVKKVGFTTLEQMRHFREARDRKLGVRLFRLANRSSKSEDLPSAA